MKFSIITCVSNPTIYRDCLLDSVKKCRSKHDIEIIPIINNNNLYSASIALNIGIDVSKSDILIFAHQDVRLLDDWFTLATKTIESLSENWAIVGAAGINSKYNRDHIGKWGGSVVDEKIIVGTVYDSDDSEAYWDGSKEISKIHCADECLFILNKKHGLRFDPGFNGFHFYGVDLCLQARAAAYDVVGAHLPIVHYGKYSASMSGNQQYWHYLRKLYNKWRLQFPVLLGTHMHWRYGYLGDTHQENELTSYISTSLEDSSGLSIGIKAMGISDIEIMD